MLEKLKELSQKFEPEVVRIRRLLHEYPEISWEEIRTTEVIEKELNQLGIKILQKGFRGTSSGILAELDSGSPGPIVALRADIDALAMQEENELPFKSKIAGKMHACGHDAHAAMLLGAAMILKELKGQWRGKVRFLFQPSEEAPPSGAKAMIAEGALKEVERIFGLHVFAALDPGVILYRGGPMMAASDTWKAEIIGAGAHGATPDRGIDPVIAAAQFVSGVQTVVSREISGLDMGVVTVGGIRSDSFVTNIIPNQVSLVGGCRSFTPEIRKKLEEAVKRIFFGVCETYRCEGKIDWIQTMPPTVTDIKVTERMKSLAMELAGEKMVQESALNTGSEDFGDYLQQIPGTFMILGASPVVGDEKRYSQHSPYFVIDESVLKMGSALHAAFVVAY